MSVDVEGGGGGEGADNKEGRRTELLCGMKGGVELMPDDGGGGVLCMCVYVCVCLKN